MAEQISVIELCTRIAKIKGVATYGPVTGYITDPHEWLAMMAEKNIALLPVAIYTTVDRFAIGVEPHTTKWVAFFEDLDWVPWKKKGDWLGQIDADFDPEEMYDTPGEAICRLWLQDYEADSQCKEGITNG